MTDAPEIIPLTEDVLCRFDLPDAFITELRERGLIAEEPVDPAIAAAMELSSAYYSGDHYRGKSIPTAKVLAELALKRGMEMRPPLTREMVRDACNDTIEARLQDYEVTNLHRALTKEQS